MKRNTATAVRQAYVVFKTHLDVGFTDLARNVVANYFGRFIPGAIALARRIRDEGRTEPFVWTTGSWLIYEYLEQASPSRRREMEAAIAAGDIVWHGLPFTTHSELMDEGLFRFGLSLSTRLDQRFGRHTIAAKMTDVPGHTRGIVPLLAEAGIRFLHIGVNPASTSPDVPDMFRWRCDGAEVVVVYHKGSYGRISLTPDGKTALCFAHTGDNLGPQSPEEIASAYEALRRQFPHATVTGAGLDPFAAELVRQQAKLPLVEAEIGDTWIHGTGSDPLKMAQFRQLLRLRQHWLDSDQVGPDDPRLDRFSRLLLVVPEHTWGMDIKTHLADYKLYQSSKLAVARKSKANFRKVEQSWAEQRQYITDAVAALGKGKLRREADRALAELKPQEGSATGEKRPPAVRGASKTARGMSAHCDDSGAWQELYVAGKAGNPSAIEFEAEHFTIGFDACDGAIIRLDRRATGRRYADKAHPLALVGYQTFSQRDYDRHLTQYVVDLEQHAHWAIPDFTKPGIDAAGAKSAWYTPALERLVMRQGQQAMELRADLAFPREAVKKFGAPGRVWLHVTMNELLPDVALELGWSGKRACRLSEAMWLSFIPRLAPGEHWGMRKMGTVIGPEEVISNGGRKMHAISPTLGLGLGGNGEMSLLIDSLDAHLVAPGRPALLDFDNRLPGRRGGMHFNLYNNVYPTNFREWYDDDGLFRFVLRMGE